MDYDTMDMDDVGPRVTVREVDSVLRTKVPAMNANAHT